LGRYLTQYPWLNDRERKSPVSSVPANEVGVRCTTTLRRTRRREGRRTFCDVPPGAARDIDEEEKGTKFELLQMLADELGYAVDTQARLPIFTKSPSFTLHDKSTHDIILTHMIRRKHFDLTK